MFLRKRLPDDKSLNGRVHRALQTHAALQTQAFVKSYIALTSEKRAKSKDIAQPADGKDGSHIMRIVAQVPGKAQMKLAQTLERLSVPHERRAQQRGAAQSARPELPPETPLLAQTIRRVVAGDGYHEYEGDSRLPADRQSTYVMDELTARELTSYEQRSILGVFREMVKNSGPSERLDPQRAKGDGREAAKPEEDAVRASSGAMISWAEVAKSLRGRLSNAHIQRLGVYFGLKGLKGKIRYKLYEERVGLMVSASPDRRLRIAFGLLDVGGDGVIGRRDVFAALASTKVEDTGLTEPVLAVFTAQGAYGIHFADSDTPLLLVLGVVAESPAEKQGVRPGQRLAKINGMSVERLTLPEVRSLLMNPARPLSMTFHMRQEQADAQMGIPAGIFAQKDLKRLLAALRMDFVTRRVRILVSSAKNLKSNEQHLGKFDPYCQVEVEGKPRTKWQTKALPESLDPEWKEEREIADFAPGETLKFTVRDKDFGTKEDDILGVATLPSARFVPAGFEGDLQLFQDENMKQKCSSMLRVRVHLSGEGGIGLSDFEKVFHDGEPVFLKQLQEVLTGCVQERKKNLIEPVKLKVFLLSATGLRNGETGAVKADAYCTCEIHNRAKYERLRTKVVQDSLDPVWNEKREILDYLPGEALRLAVWDSDGRGGTDEPLGSCVLASERFWPAGFDGQVQLTEEQTRREKKSTVTLRLRVTTPESHQPHQFASRGPEPSSQAFEKFEADMKELRARMPFLKEADFAWHTRVFEALRDEDWLIQRARLVASADKIFGIPVGHIAGRLFEAVSPKNQPVGVLDWAQFLERHRSKTWDAQQERIHLTFSLYDLDGDGTLSLADAISLSSEVVRLELIYGQ
ncbi:unnamed protein product, partial [Effrenium voratum]